MQFLSKKTIICPYCREENIYNSKKCMYCWEDILSEDLEKEIKWKSFLLIVLIISLIFTIISINYTLYWYIKLINDWFFWLLSDPYGFSYIEWFKYLFLYELLWNFIIILFLLIIVYLYFLNHKNFKIFFNTYLVIYFLFILLDTIFYHNISDFVLLDKDRWYLDLFQAFIYAFFWWFYINKSKIVKNTFVEKSYKNKNILIFLLLISLFFMSIYVIMNINLNKLNYSEFDYWMDICKNNFWESYYIWKLSDNWEFLCECNEWYKFSSWENSICIKIR